MNTLRLVPYISLPGLAVDPSLRQMERPFHQYRVLLTRLIQLLYLLINKRLILDIDLESHLSVAHIGRI